MKTFFKNLSVLLTILVKINLVSLANVSQRQMLQSQLDWNADFCDTEKFCAGHLLCRANWEKATKCDKYDDVRLGDVDINSVLRIHNERRNEVAVGDHLPFPYAYRMPTVQWDPTLAEVSKAASLTCDFNHDKCRKTPKYNRAGQNICWYKGNRDPYQVVENCINSWFDEIKDAVPDDVIRYKKSKGMIGHFTAMMQDRTDRVGCSMVHFNKNEIIIFCNYGFTNIKGSRVYQRTFSRSRVGMGCLKGMNPQYPGLCHPDEDILGYPTSDDVDAQEVAIAQTMPSTEMETTSGTGTGPTTTQRPLFDSTIDEFLIIIGEVVEVIETITQTLQAVADSVNNLLAQKAAVLPES